MDEKSIKRAITRISHEIIEKNKGVKDIVLLGIKTRGVPLAQRISENIFKFEEKNLKVNLLDITYYRDDYIHTGRIQLNNIITVDVKDKTVVLIDDVIYTGRTCRAAMNAVMDSGRPRKVQLAVMVDRGHRELPIRPDFIGKNIPTSKDEIVHVMLNEVDGKNKVILIKNEKLDK
ncbi:MAG: bifunctional pyr operon transcriptional regulator/uracil phosphoribosyltransferase PyrR [Eubacteriaceae bacterium]